MLPERGKRIGIEKSITRKRDAAQHTVINNPLKDIQVFCLAFQQKHPVVPESIGNRSTGFTISGSIGQVISRAKTFPGTGRTDPAGQIHFSENNILPEFVQSLLISFIAS